MAFSLFADDNNSNSNSTLNSKEGIVLNQEFQIDFPVPEKPHLRNHFFQQCIVLALTKK